MSGARRPRLLVLAVGLGVGGAEEMIRESLPLLEGQGFEVALWSLKDGGILGEELRRSRGPVLSLGGSRRFSPALLGRLWRGLQRQRFDLIHSHLFWANLAARLAGRAAGVPILLNSHHGTDDWVHPSRRFLERATISLADRVVACSEAVRGCAVRELGLGEERVVTVPNGIRVERFVQDGGRDRARAGLGIAADQKVVGTVGRLDEPVKGLAVLVAAMERVAARLPGTLCLVVGEGPARAGLEAAVARKNLAAHVRFLGERRDIPDLLQALDLYVQPSLFEGFGLATLEAMAAGKAVVASRAGGLPEVVEDGKTGDLVAPGDPESLAQRMILLLQDCGRRERYGREGRARARQAFPLEKMVLGWTDLYRRLLGEKGWREAA